MIWIYRLLYIPCLLLVIPYYGLRMWRRGGYRKDFQHRLGAFRRIPPTAPGKRRIWIQAVSVGEVAAVGPLLEALDSSGRFELVLTTTTSTGYREARKRYRDRVHAIGLFPLDFWSFNALAWKRIRPDMICLMDSELWPEHLHRAGTGSVPAFLVNARISDKSFRRYRRVRGLTRRLLAKFETVYPASDLDAERLCALGLPVDRLVRTGSVKFDVDVGPVLSPAERAALLRELRFEAPSGTAPFVLLGASTWPGEETRLLRILAKLREGGMDARLLLVPRHAERGEELARLLRAQSLPWQRRSSGESAGPEPCIYLADTTGELVRLSQAADLAFIGKSLPPNRGGQTPIETAGLGIAMVFGPEMSNFRSVADSLCGCGAARQVADGEALEQAVLDLAASPEARRTMAQAARQWHHRNRGSSRRIAEDMLQRLGD